MVAFDSNQKIDLRRYPRHVEAGVMRITWQDGALGDRVCMARVADVSAAGLRLRTGQAIPLRSYIYCNDPTTRVSRRGWIRHCTFRKAGYEIGVELSEPIGAGGKFHL